jgi:hypothetical protein
MLIAGFSAHRLLSVSSPLLPAKPIRRACPCARDIKVVDSRGSGDRLFSAPRRGGGGGRRDRQFCTETHHHDYIGIVLALVGLAYLCWLLFALAVYALPLFAGITAGACHLSHWVGAYRSDHRRPNCRHHHPHCWTDRPHDTALALCSCRDRAPLRSAGRYRGISCRTWRRAHWHPR